MAGIETKYTQQRNVDDDATTSDEQDQGSGKVAQAHNSAGNQDPTQLHQERRTPESRHDRDVHVGSGNQVQSRRGAPGSGASPKSGGGHRGAG